MKDKPKTPSEPFILHTPRLRLEPCRREGLEPLHEMWCYPEMRRFLFDGREISREEALSFVTTSAVNFARQGYGLWIVYEEPGETPVGFAGLLSNDQGEPKLIFGTDPKFWRKGYAGEAATAVIRYALGNLQMNRVLADVDEPNEGSRRILEKLGMRFLRKAWVKDKPLLYYEIRRE